MADTFENHGGVLGDRLHLTGWIIVGKLDYQNSGYIIASIIDSIGMTPAHGSSLCCYPAGGKGGVGFTVFQPITESFIILDAWPEREIPGGYLVIGSCKSYCKEDVAQVFDNLQLDVFEASSDCLVLPVHPKKEQ